MSIEKSCDSCKHADVYPDQEPCKSCHTYGGKEVKYIKWEPKEEMQSYADFVKQRQFNSGAVRDAREGKGRCDLLPAAALLRLAKHYETGAKHYGDRNWEKGIDISAYIDSGFRHLLKYMDGQIDEDHLCAAVWNLIGAMWTEEKHPNLKEAYYEQFKKNVNEGCDDSNTEGM